jgi:hypothetical protein
VPRIPRPGKLPARLTDWRLAAGVLTPLLVAAGLAAYALYRPGPAGGSFVVAGFVAVLALVAVLLALPRRLGAMAGYAGLLTIVGALFIRSQLRRGALAPPIEEWTIAVSVVCGVVALGGLSWRSLRAPAAIGPPSPRLTAAGALAVVVLATSCLCMPGVKYLSDGSDTSARSLLAASPSEEDLIPVPADTHLVQSGDGVYVFAGPAGVSRNALALQIVEHYQRQDWPLARVTLSRRDFFQGCRPVRGLITWHERCMQVIVLEGSENRVDRPTIPGTVNVYLT